MTLFFTKNPYFGTRNYFSLRPYFTQFVLCLTSYNITRTSQTIEGRMHGLSPYLKCLGDHPPCSPPYVSTRASACVSNCIFTSGFCIVLYSSIYIALLSA